jgi:hypothetical protein
LTYGEQLEHSIQHPHLDVEFWGKVQVEGAVSAFVGSWRQTFESYDLWLDREAGLDYLRFTASPTFNTSCYTVAESIIAVVVNVS